MDSKEAFGACPNYNEWIGIGRSKSQKATLDSRVTSLSKVFEVHCHLAVTP
jgi:hypothetical protein